MRRTVGGIRRIGWQHLLEMAGSPEKESRFLALVRGYAWVEHALDAAGAPGPRKPIATRVLRAIGNPTLASGLDEKSVREAIQIRHRASHEDVVPDPAEARKALWTLLGVWHALSRHFVNLASAVEIGRTLREHPGIQVIALYGSLARGKPEPNDIDLLVLDDGRYSAQLHPCPYSDGGFDVVKATLEALVLIGENSSKLERCVRCRWLDVLVLDGDRFGRDPSYTSDIRQVQPDPWFFLNMARDIKELEPSLGRYVETERAPFAELRRTFRQLEAMGFA